FQSVTATPRSAPGSRASSRPRSVAVELDGVAVRVLDVDRRPPAPARDPHAGPLDPRAYLLPLGAREPKAEVVEAARAGVEPPPAPDEVQEVAPAGRLEKDHARVRERGPEPEDVRIEALGALEVPRLEREVAEPAVHPRHTRRTSASAGAGAPGSRPGT